MTFFMGFIASSLVFVMFISLFVLLKEEIAKKAYNKIIPGQTYYVQSLGEVTVTESSDKIVSYRIDQGSVHTVETPVFNAIAKVPLKPEASAKYSSHRTKRVSPTYYNRKGRIFDIYAD